MKKMMTLSVGLMLMSVMSCSIYRGAVAERVGRDGWLEAVNQAKTRIHVVRGLQAARIES